MNLSRSLLISVVVTLAATTLLGLVFGGKAFGLFLLLPIGFWFNRRRQSPPPNASDSRPIEPE